MSDTIDYVNQRLEERNRDNGDQRIDIAQLLEERGRIHGDAETTHRVAYQLFDLMENHFPVNNLRPSSRAMLFIICVKISRALQNPTHADHWVDIAGYSELIKRVETTHAHKTGQCDTNPPQPGPS